MKGIRKNKKTMGIIIALVVVAIVGGTFAYWNQTHTVENPFNTGKKYTSTVVEDFNPEEGVDWQPGVDVNKTVRVVNSGNQDLIIRVKLDEKWVRDGETDPYKELKAEVDGDKIYTANQAEATDGLVELDDSVVLKHLSSSAKWIDGGDGWYYYTVNLKEGETTDNWLESVELHDELDLGAIETKKYITAATTIDADTEWEEYTDEMPKKDSNGDTVLHNKTETVYKKDSDDKDLIGYVDSNYTLTVTTQTVQATKEAVLASFGKTEDELSALPVDWEYREYK